ncbi:MAG: hypothetical protein ABJ084_10560 [Halioglobus sp.]
MKELYLHVGPHKTATTYVQKILHANRDRLAKSGIEYPEQFFLYNGHHLLYDEIRTDSRSEVYLSNIRALNSLSSNLIISSERLWNLSPTRLASVISDFDEFRVIIIYSYRTPTIRFFSEWQENIKHGSCDSFLEDCGKAYRKPFASDRLNPLPKLEEYARLFGLENIRILDYEAGLRTGTTVNSFLNAIGSDADVDELNEITNPSLPTHIIEIVRALNSIHAGIGKRSTSEVREKFFLMQSEFRAEVRLLKNIMSGSPGQIVNLGNTFVDTYVYNNIRARFGALVQGNQLTKPFTLERTIQDPSWIWGQMGGEDAIGILRKMYSQLMTQ